MEPLRYRTRRDFLNLTETQSSRVGQNLKTIHKTLWAPENPTTIKACQEI